MRHAGDITALSGYDLEPVDVITFGSPCQDFSIAGGRKGVTGKHSSLITHAFRIIEEMREETHGQQPRFAVWENSPGAFSSNKGKDFQTILQALAKIADKYALIPGPPISGSPKRPRWRNAGAIMGDRWSIAWRVLDAQFWGVPQRRRRIALVTDFRARSAPKILFERKGLPGGPTEIGEAREGDVGGVANNINGTECLTFALHPKVTGTLCASGAGTARPAGQGNEADFCIVSGNSSPARRLTPLECERLQGFPDGWTDILSYMRNGKIKKVSDSERYRALGNSIALPPWGWVLGNIVDRLSPSATLGSLFDGIGGFPLIWEHINGNGSAIWASEIDPFCIAVTEYHFNGGGA